MTRNRNPYISERQRRLLEAKSPDRLALVIPKGDDPLSYLQRFGWWLANERVWPAEARHNALLYYRTGSMRSRRMGDALQYLPWLLLAAAELAPLVLAKPPDGAPYLMMLLIGEIFFLPFVFLTFLYVQLWQRLRRLYDGGGWETLGATPLSATALATAPAVPLLSAHLAANALSACLLVSVLLHYFLQPMATSTLTNGIILLMLLGLIGLRYFIFRCLMENTIVAGLDDFFRHEHGPHAIVRGLRRIFRPIYLLFLIPGVLFMPFFFIWGLTAGMPNLQAIYLILCPLGFLFGPIPVLIIALGARMETRTQWLLSQVLSQRDEWNLRGKV